MKKAATKPEPKRARAAARTAPRDAPRDRSRDRSRSRSRSPGLLVRGAWYEVGKTDQDYAQATGAIASGDLLELEVSDKTGTPQGVVIAEVVGQTLDKKCWPVSDSHHVVGSEPWHHP